MNPSEHLSASNNLHSSERAPNHENVVVVPTYTGQSSPNAGENHSPSINSGCFSLEPLALAEETSPFVPYVCDDVNYFSRGQLYVPFVGQAHILKSYVFGDTPCIPFIKKEIFFKSVVKPEGNWIEFSLEVAQFLSNNRVYRLNPHQFASLLFDNLTNKTIIMDLERFDLTKVFEVYQVRWYSIKEAGRDFKRFVRDPCTIFYHGLKFSEYIHLTASSPKGRLLLGLYALTPYQLTALYNSNYTFFMSSGTLAIKDDEHDKVNQLMNLVIKFSQLHPKKGYNSRSKKS